MRRLRNLIKLLRFTWRHPLNARHRVAATLRIVRWQLGSRLLRTKVIVPWIDDASLVVRTGETGLTGNIYVGLSDYKDMGFLLQVLREGDTFVDVGANAGAYTVLAAAAAGSQVIAFEPMPATTERLLEQIRVNGLHDRVIVRSLGVGERREVLPFSGRHSTVNRVDPSGGGPAAVLVEVTTLDDEVELTRPIVLKIDVEGFEYSVLKGATSLLDSDMLLAVVIELNGSSELFGQSNGSIHAELLRHRMVPITYDPQERRVTRLSGTDTSSANTIYVKDIERIQSRCVDAPRHRIHTAEGAVI